LLSTRPPTSTLFPYTTLFRSAHREVGRGDRTHERVVAGARDRDVQQVLGRDGLIVGRAEGGAEAARAARQRAGGRQGCLAIAARDRKSTRLNSSHEWISYAVF